MVKLFLESIVMLIGGRTTNNKKNKKPVFLSLNPTLVPLPACLTGSKSNIDNLARHRAPLIIGQGIMRAKLWMQFNAEESNDNLQLGIFFQMGDHSCVVELQITENVTAMRDPFK